MKAKEFIPVSKPRNFVAKNQKTAGAGAHKDKKRAEKQGDVKHKAKQFAEGDDPWGDQGRFAGDAKANIGGTTLKKIQSGDTVSYFGEKAKVVDVNHSDNFARISANSKTLNVRLSDLKRVGGGVAEGSEIKIPTEDGITMQDIRLMAGEGKLTKKTVLQAIAVIRKQRKEQGVAEGSAKPETLAKRAEWQKTPLSSNKIVIDGYTINFTPTALVISKGGKVLWKKEGNYSKPTNSTLAGAKKLVTGLSRQGQPDEKQMFGKVDPDELKARREHKKKWHQAAILSHEKKISFQQAWSQLFGEQDVSEVSKATIDRYVAKASDAHGHADFAARMSKNDPDKRSYHVDQKKTAEKRRQGISRALDRMSREESIEENYGNYSFKVGNWRYEAEEDREDDNIKMFHSAISPEGKRFGIDFTPYGTMTPETFKLWVQLGKPGRQGRGPLDNQQIMQMAQSKK
jgi:hypothetical protein